MKFKYVLFFIFLLLCNSLSVSLRAQTADLNLTLAQALTLALQNNERVKVEKSHLDMAATERRIVNENKLPDLDLKASYGHMTNLKQYEAGGIFSKPSTYERYKALYGTSLDARMPIYQGGALKLKEKVGEIAEEIQQLQVSKTEKQVKLEVITAYLEIYHQLEQKSLIEANLVEDEALEKQITALKKEGMVTQNEILRTRLQKAAHQMALNTTNNNIAIAEHLMKALLSLPENTMVHIDTTIVLRKSTLASIAPTDTAISLAHQDDLLLNQKEAESLGYDKKIIRAGYLPQIALVAEYGFNYPNYKFFPPQPYLYSMGMIGLNLKFSISNLFKNAAKVKLAEQKILHNHLEKTQLETEINHAVFIAQTRYQEAMDQIRVSAIAVQQAEENYRLVKNKYKNQLSLITELIDANHTLMEAKATLITSQIQKSLKYYQYQFATGNI